MASREYFDAAHGNSPALFSGIDLKEVIQQFLDEITAELAQGNRLEFRDFGVFEPRSHPARIAQNPKTLEQVLVPAKRSVKFKMGRLMRERLNGG